MARAPLKKKKNRGGGMWRGLLRPGGAAGAFSSFSRAALRDAGPAPPAAFFFFNVVSLRRCVGFDSCFVEAQRHSTETVHTLKVSAEASLFHACVCCF